MLVMRLSTKNPLKMIFEYLEMLIILLKHFLFTCVKSGKEIHNQNNFMRKFTVTIFSVVMISTFIGANAQSINNRSWKSYIDNPINDTVTFHFRSDSSYVTDSHGDIKVRTSCTVSGDTLAIEDYGTEAMGCPGRKGVYKVKLDGNSFVLELIDDPCDGRAQALHNRKWIEAKRE